MSLTNNLLEAAPPWILIDVLDSQQPRLIPSFQYQSASRKIRIRKLRGKKMRSIDGLMDEFGSALQFFDEFGENWYALEDCLSTLDEWDLPDAFLLVITDPLQVLEDVPPENLAWLINILSDTGAWWAKPIIDNPPFSRPAVPFHVVLQCGPGEEVPCAQKYGEIPILIRSPL